MKDIMFILPFAGGALTVLEHGGKLTNMSLFILIYVEKGNIFSSSMEEMEQSCVGYIKLFLVFEVDKILKREKGMLPLRYLIVSVTIDLESIDFREVKGNEY